MTPSPPRRTLTPEQEQRLQRSARRRLVRAPLFGAALGAAVAAATGQSIAYYTILVGISMLMAIWIANKTASAFFRRYPPYFVERDKSDQTKQQR